MVAGRRLEPRVIEARATRIWTHQACHSSHALRRAAQAMRSIDPSRMSIVLQVRDVNARKVIHVVPACVCCMCKPFFLSFLRAARVAGRPAVNSPRRSPHSQATFCDAADVWASPCETKLQRQSARVQRNDRSFVSGALGARQTAWLLRDGTRRAQLP